MTDHLPAPGPRTPGTRDVVEDYCDDLLLALRMRDVPGHRIGEVLTEVRDHLASSEEDPAEAFGAPPDYADALTAGRDTPRRAARVLDTARNAAGVAGLLWTAAGATALLTREAAVLTEVQVVLPVAVAVAAPLLVDAVATTRRRAAVVGRGLLVGAVLAAVAVAHAWVGPLVEVTVPAAVLLVPGLLVAGAWTLATARLADPVVHPLQDRASTTRQRRRAGALLTTLLLLLLVVPVALAVGLRQLG